MSWIPSERTFIVAVSTAYRLQRSCPELFTGDRIEINPALSTKIAEIRGVSVEVHEDELLLIRGYLLKIRGEPKYDIVIAKISTKCWKRLALCKELCHVLTDASEVFARTPVEQIGSAITVRKNFQLDAPLSSEEFCFLMAAELIIPPHKRATLANLVKTGTSDYDVANLIKVPEWIISYYYRRTPLAEVSDLIRKLIDGGKI